MHISQNGPAVNDDEDTLEVLRNFVGFRRPYWMTLSVILVTQQHKLSRTVYKKHFR